MFIDGAGYPCDEQTLTPTGEIQRSPSTRKGNDGGISIQELFLDRSGRAVTRHTVYDNQGCIIHGPHFRPGGFK